MNILVKQDWLQHTYSIRHARNAHVKWDWLQVSCSMRHAHKTYMLSKADFKSRTLFGTHRYAHFQWDWPQHSYSIRHAQNCTCQLTLKTSRSLFETHKNAYVKRNCLKSRTLFSTHRKRTCRVRLTTSLVLYSTRTKTHMSSKIALSFAHIKYGWRRGHTHRKRTLFGTLRKRICQFRLTTSLTLYSARTENAHI